MWQLWLVKKWVVGSRTGRIVGLVLGVILTLFAMTLWYQNTIEKRIMDALQVQQLLQDQQTRKRIDEAVANSPRDFDSSVEWLRQRQSRQ